MFIGEIASKSGLSQDTIRWYEKIGLITSTRTKGKANNYRVFDEDTLERLQLIRISKSFGLSINEIGILLSMEDDGGVKCSNVTELFNSKLMKLEEQINNLTSVKNKIILAKAQCEGACVDTMYSIVSVK